MLYVFLPFLNFFVFLQLQLEMVGSTSRAASRGSARGEGNDNEDEDNNGSDNEGELNDGEENENEGEDGNDDATAEKRGRSKTAKRAGNRKSKSPHPNKDAASSGSASPNKRVRRPSMDNIGKFPASAPTAKSGVSLTSLAAAKKTATAVKGKSTNKTAKKRRGSFVGVADKPDAGEESEHEEEGEGEGMLLSFMSFLFLVRQVLSFGNLFVMFYFLHSHLLL